MPSGLALGTSTTTTLASARWSESTVTSACANSIANWLLAISVECRLQFTHSTTGCVRARRAAAATSSPRGSARRRCVARSCGRRRTLAGVEITAATSGAPSAERPSVSSLTAGELRASVAK